MTWSGDAAPLRAVRPILLIVDDHQDTRQMYAEFLSGTFEILQASDGAEALAVVRNHPPDLLITDLSLPGMDGFELIAAIRAQPAFARLPIMSLSGYGGQSIEERAREVGCDRVLQKPCMPDALVAAANELLHARAGPDGPVTGRTILIVEDDPDTREMLGRFLELEGFSVRTAGNGRQALERLADGERPCVIVLDLMMPVMDGWQFRREQASDAALADIPVIVVSAAGRDHAEQVDADGFLLKPVNLDELLQRVQRFCV